MAAQQSVGTEGRPSLNGQAAAHLHGVVSERMSSRDFSRF